LQTREGNKKQPSLTLPHKQGRGPDGTTLPNPPLLRKGGEQEKQPSKCRPWRSGRSIDNDPPIPPLISNKGRLGGVGIVSPFVLKRGWRG